jgi:putative ATP-dependent endonuclease of the OLD family
MYLSRIKIKNYRSVKELDLEFKKGKNVIVGKNNSGKSNLIRAIDLLLGENSPTYHKSENITDNDFNQGDTTQPIFIFCELTREVGEELNYDAIYNCFGYYYHSRIESWTKNEKGKSIPIKSPILHALREDLQYFWGDLDALMNIDEDDDSIDERGYRLVDKEYVNPKLRNQSTFEGQLDNKYKFAFAFRATKRAGRVEKEIRFLYRENEGTGWFLAFSAPIRNELLQSAIIPSFREPASELRINQWSWFGKLLKKYINGDDSELVRVFGDLKNVSNRLFSDLNSQITGSNIKVAFPNTNISFQFNPDTKVDIYKSALIYVNDGFNSILQDKGSGIQSAVIIGLFHYYTRYLAHIGSSLLAIEEPELFLHPQARRVISNRLDDFLEGDRNQVIITTHSNEFINTAHEQLNIVVVRKEDSLGTIATYADFLKSKDKQILLRSQNSEMFFADKVILVEGGDKFILESIAQKFGSLSWGIKRRNILGDAWLNDNNISIISVGGKTEFWKYRNKLDELKIPNLVLADFDFFLRQLSEFATKLKWTEDDKNKLNTLKGKLGDVQGLKRFSQLVSNQKEVQNYLSELKISKGIFVLSGELEDFFTRNCTEGLNGLSLGKEEKAIYVVSNIVNDRTGIDTLVNCDEYYDILSYCVI